MREADATVRHGINPGGQSKNDFRVMVGPGEY